MIRIPRKILAGCCALLALAACTDLPSAEEIAATARVIPDANDLRRVINENRFFTLRSKMRNLVREHWEDTHWALAATEDGCPSTWSMTWFAADIEDARRSSLNRCRVRNSYFHPDIAKFSKKPCTCRIVAEDEQMTVPRQELPQYLWAAVTAFNMENGKLIIQRGMMGIEKLSFVDQEILVLDREGAVACTGRYDPQDDRQGYFHLNCASRNLKAEGDMDVKNLLVGRRHLVGRAETDRGGKYAFVTNFMPDDVKTNYPELFDLKFYK
jgi:hypothetical protein